MKKNLFLILGNQLFDPKVLLKNHCTHVFMAEDFGLCTHHNYHKLKLYFFLCAMREYRDELVNHGIKVTYYKLDERFDKLKYSEFLCSYLNKNKIKHINLFEIEDKFCEEDIKQSLQKAGISTQILPSPMFIFKREEFDAFHKNTKIFRLANFYKMARKKLKILIDADLQPIGGKWSFDEENRKRIPKNEVIPQTLGYEKSKYHNETVNLINKQFAKHPGEMTKFWFPVQRKHALRQLDHFLTQKLEKFGIYEDAMLKGENFLFHSCISPLINVGLLSPDIILKRVISMFKSKKVPLNSVEGFVRQILGWREFIRGIYQMNGDKQRQSNHWNHKNGMKKSWYDATTGIDPLDDCIKLAQKDGYSHHIPRLMVICNLMNLSEIDPKLIFKWFMEMYIDSSDWVMVPNVFGMATYADGGLMSTKPYTCGSNYILKMSDYKKGEWCEIVDGLYWRFIDRHRTFYESNARLSFQVRMLMKMDQTKKERIFAKANNFIDQNTKYLT